MKVLRPIFMKELLLQTVHGATHLGGQVFTTLKSVYIIVMSVVGVDLPAKIRTVNLVNMKFKAPEKCFQLRRTSVIQNVFKKLAKNLLKKLVLLVSV
jgi:hypothetical protein